VPWIDPGAEDGQRVPYIKTAVLDEVEGMGASCTASSMLWTRQHSIACNIVSVQCSESDTSRNAALSQDWMYVLHFD